MDAAAAVDAGIGGLSAAARVVMKDAPLKGWTLLHCIAAKPAPEELIRCVLRVPPPANECFSAVAYSVISCSALAKRR